MRDLRADDGWGFKTLTLNPADQIGRYEFVHYLRFNVTGLFPRGVFIIRFVIR